MRRSSRRAPRDFGTVFRSHCDTELLPAGYLAGDDLFARLEGIFAIGLWDNAGKRLVLAGDSIGTKPLFSSRVGDTVRFASEIKGILADPFHPREFDAGDCIVSSPWAMSDLTRRRCGTSARSNRVH